MGKVQQIYGEAGKESLSDVSQLWRYIPYKTLFTYLKGQVFIPSVEKLGEGDPFEGNFPFPVANLKQVLPQRESPPGEGESFAGSLECRALDLAGEALSNRRTDDGDSLSWGRGPG